jgi:hypothetical protein
VVLCLLAWRKWEEGWIHVEWEWLPTSKWGFGESTNRLDTCLSVEVVKMKGLGNEGVTVVGVCWWGDPIQSNVQASGGAGGARTSPTVMDSMKPLISSSKSLIYGWRGNWGNEKRKEKRDEEEKIVEPPKVHFLRHCEHAMWKSKSEKRVPWMKQPYKATVLIIKRFKIPAWFVSKDTWLSSGRYQSIIEFDCMQCIWPARLWEFGQGALVTLHFAVAH